MSGTSQSRAGPYLQYETLGGSFLRARVPSEALVQAAVKGRSADSCAQHHVVSFASDAFQRLTFGLCLPGATE